MRPGPSGPGRQHRKIRTVFLPTDILLIALSFQAASVTRHTDWTKHAEAQSCTREEPISKVARSRNARPSRYTDFVQKSITIKVSLEAAL